MGDVVGAVVLLHVLDHAVAAFIVEVHVYIRHRDALRVEETLEEQVVAYRVEVGDAQAVGHAGTGGRATSRSHGHPVAAAPVDEVLHDEEVVRETHIRNGHQLEVEAFLLLLGERVPVAAARSLVGEVAEEGHRLAELVAAVVLLYHVAVVVLAYLVAAVVYDVGVLLKVVVYVLQEGAVYLELGQHVAPVDLVSLHLLAHLQGIGEDFRMVGEDFRHLLLALEVLLLGVAQALGIVHVGVGGQADEPVVHRAVLLAHEVHVVGGHHLHPVLLREPEDFGAVLLLEIVGVQGQARHLGLVHHHLQVVVLPEDALVPLNCLVHALLVARKYALGDFPGHTGRAADEVLVVLLYHLVAHPRAVVVALDVAYGNDLHKVPVALVVLCQKYEVVVLLVVVVLELVVVVAGDVDFAAYDGLDIRELFGDVAEVLDTVHVTVVGDGEAGHPELLGTGEKLLYVAQSVKD